MRQSAYAVRIQDLRGRSDRTYGDWQRRHELSRRKRRSTGTDLHVALARQVAAGMSTPVLVFVLMGVLLRRHSVVGMLVRTGVCVSHRWQDGAARVRPWVLDAACGDIRQPGYSQHNRNCPASSDLPKRASHLSHVPYLLRLTPLGCKKPCLAFLKNLSLRRFHIVGHCNQPLAH